MKNYKNYPEDIVDFVTTLKGTILETLLNELYEKYHDQWEILYNSDLILDNNGKHTISPKFIEWLECGNE